MVAAEARSNIDEHQHEAEPRPDARANQMTKIYVFYYGLGMPVSFRCN